MDGCVFSIEEFSTFDGPGIRMSVFLKGCPLRCMWCHNPEGQSFTPEFLKGNNGCLHCGACMRTGALCEESITVCPQHLIRRSGKAYDPDSLCALIQKNAAVLSAAGGGVTFSGGEPLAQPDFLLACLQQLEGTVHRAVQTSGFAQPEVFARILRHCDYVLYDLKLMDDGKHRHYTGQSNRNILANYRQLAQSGVPFITRIPLIPTVNDTEENIRATAAFLRENGVSRIELLPYNKFAGSKYSLMGKTYRVDFDESLPPQPHKEVFKAYGIEVRVL